MLDKYVDSETKQKISNDPENILQLIPAGTKGVIRGNKFNEIVKVAILEKITDSVRFEICFDHFGCDRYSMQFYCRRKNRRKSFHV